LINSGDKKTFSGDKKSPLMIFFFVVSITYPHPICSLF